MLRMNTKLTLSLDKTIIDNAKKTLTKDTSLSKLIENYFKALLASRTITMQNSPIVEELTGIASISNDHSDKDIITGYLLEKYK